MKTFKSFSEAYVRPETTLTAGALQQKAIKAAEAIVKKYEKHAVSGTKTTRAAPNTGSFVATSSGMIKVVKGQNVSSGMFNRYHFPLIQVGTLVDLSIRKKIQDEFIAKIKTIAKVEKPEGAFYSSDGHAFFVDKVGGTNWGGVGLVIQ